jgi:hypothetical protein
MNAIQNREEIRQELAELLHEFVVADSIVIDIVVDYFVSHFPIQIPDLPSNREMVNKLIDIQRNNVSNRDMEDIARQIIDYFYSLKEVKR